VATTSNPLLQSVQAATFPVSRRMPKEHLMDNRKSLHATARRRPARPAGQRGFTLIELIVAVAVVAILASVALPSYADYIVRGRLADATTGLAVMQLRMEQYYQDHRSYAGGPCASGSQLGSFSLRCATPSDDSYTIVATGTGSTAGFEYSVDSQGRQRTLRLPPAWGSTPSGGYACWVTRRGATC
jgi:type IV pilus assembly protein PilE